MKELVEAMASRGIPDWGVCRYGDTLPLIPCRAVSRIPEGARSVLACVFPYRVGDYPRRNLSRYAMIPDYHRVAGDLLGGACQELEQAFPGERFAAFVDSSPIREVEAARLAGLGVVGKNGLLIHPRYGSLVFLGTVVTTLELIPGKPRKGDCGGCGRCLAACPTGAIAPSQPFRRELCLSHITQKKGELSPWEREQVAAGGMVWGCDRCLDACPHNNHVPLTPLEGFCREIEPVFTPEALDRFLEDKPCGFRGGAVLLRNWKLVAGESPTDDKRS